ncbi:hypothetical protein B0H13DRAFT_1855580 [Mycena leptocephala]|nr:hypothetical protein B0H13DRAFT_1855580 [Mycena leptocephala]
MDPQEAARKLREQAQLIPHPSAPHLRQRKRIAGTSTFSVTDTGAQTNFPPSSVNLTPSSTLNASAFTSGIQFRPPVTPASLSHLHVLDPDDISYDRYRGKPYRDDNTKLASLIEIIMSDEKGKEKFSRCMEPYVLDLASETVAEQMETRRKNSILPGIEAVTPAFMENWTLDEQVDHSPFLTQILETAAQTERAKRYNKKKKPQKRSKQHLGCFCGLLEVPGRP